MDAMRNTASAAVGVFRRPKVAFCEDGGCRDREGGKGGLGTAATPVR